jgi:hypothetical protein
MDSTTPYLLLVLALYTLVKLIKYVRGKDWDSTLSITVAWVGGAVLAWVFASSSIGKGTVLPIGKDGIPLTGLNLADYLFVGLFLASGTSGFADLIRSFDRTRTTATPSLVDGKTRVIAQGGPAKAEVVELTNEGLAIEVDAALDHHAH